MEHHVTWGLPVILYLFLAGAGAGAVTVSASVLLRGGGFGPSRWSVARYGALIGPLPVILGTALIVLELGAPFRVLNLFKTITLSPMSIGSWFLGAFIGISLLYAATFILPDLFPNRLPWVAKARTALAWICLPSGIAVAVYTGVMLGAMPSRPLWNSPILALLFLFSALSAGVAAIVLAMALFQRHESTKEGADIANSSYLLASSDALLLAGELGIIFLFIMFSHLTIGNPKEAVRVFLPGGELASAFWGLVVAIGILLPFFVELAMVMPKLLYGRPYRALRSLEVLASLAVLIGGVALRYLVVVGGQITGPVGL